MAEGVPNNNQRGQRGGLDKARHIVPTALLVRVQCFKKSLHKAVHGPSTRPIVLSMINGSYCRRWRRLNIFKPAEMNTTLRLSRLSCVTCHVPKYIHPDSLLRYPKTTLFVDYMYHTCSYCLPIICHYDFLLQLNHTWSYRLPILRHYDFLHQLYMHISVSKSYIRSGQQGLRSTALIYMY